MERLVVNVILTLDLLDCVTNASEDGLEIAVGECANHFGPPRQCDTCLTGWTGANCDACAPGWAGDDCDTCADGWLPPTCDQICDGFGCCKP